VNLKHTKVVILCGGKGTRAYPFTEYYPKVMMPIAGTPILIHLMRIYAAQGFRHFVLAAGHRKEMLLDYFENRTLDWQVDIVDTGAESDTGDRILKCADHVGDTFFATYGDGLGDVDLHDLLHFHHGHGGAATLTTVPLRSQYGLVVFNDAGRVSHFDEKPLVKNFWINAGFFAFNKSVFDHWKGSNLEGHVMPSIAERGELFTYRHEGFWKSMDTSKDQTEMERLWDAGDPPWTVKPLPKLRRAAGA
jgi:glucose-1-phosphate cytidylyltransferase